MPFDEGRAHTVGDIDLIDLDRVVVEVADGRRPGQALLAHASDIGIIRTPDGRAYAVAIYVTGQGTRLAREERIAQIARSIYDGYTVIAANDNTNWVNARY